MVIVFAGADNYDSSHLFCSSPVLTEYYRGADTVLLTGGGVVQAPFQMLQAECTWNSPSRRIRIRIPRDYKKRLRLMEGLSRNTLQPAEIFGKNGFLHLACRLVYGEAAAAAMVRLHGDLSREHTVGPLVHSFSAETVPYLKRRLQRHRTRAEITSSLVQRASRFPEIVLVTARALTCVERALAGRDLADETRADLSFMRQLLRVGSAAAKTMERYAAILARGAGKRRHLPDRSALAQFDERLASFQRVVDSVIGRNRAERSLDPAGGTVGHWYELLDWLKRERKAMAHPARWRRVTSAVTGWNKSTPQEAALRRQGISW